MTAIDELIKAYKSVLTGNIIVNGTAIPIYVDFVPRQKNESEYLFIQNPLSVGVESKQDQDKQISIQFIIYSRRLNNDGSTVRSIAKQFYDLVYPDTTNTTIIPDGYQNVTMKMVSDNILTGMDTQDIDKGVFQVKERVIIFKHDIS